MYDVVFINSGPMPNHKIRGLGPHLLAEELRRHGYSAIVLDFIEYWNIYEFGKAIDKVVTQNTKAIAFSLTWTTSGTGTEKIIEKAWNTETSNDVYIGNYLVNGKFTWMLDRIKQNNNQVKIIAGGSKAPSLDTILGSLVDHIICGYGETQFIDLIKSPLDYPRIISHDTKAHAEHTCFDFAKSRASFTPNTILTPHEVVPMECSRGCRFKCKFCSFPLIGMKNIAGYIKTKEAFRDELIYNYEHFGITKYSIQDDTFNDTIEKVRFFADVVDSLPFKIYFWCYLRADLLVTQPEQIELLHQMGLVHTWFGIETYNQRAGKVVGKGLDPERIKDMLHQAKSVWKGDVFVQQGYIVGLPHENINSVVHHAEWLASEECPVDNTLFIPLYILPKELQNRYVLNYTSEFDRTYQQYGYSFPHAKNPDNLKAVQWEKIDGSDITSFEIAQGICNRLNPWVEQKKPLYPLKPGIFDTARPFKELEDFDTIRNMPLDDYDNLMASLPTLGDTEAYIEKLRETYIEPLLQSL